MRKAFSRKTRKEIVVIIHKEHNEAPTKARTVEIIETRFKSPFSGRTESFWRTTGEKDEFQVIARLKDGSGTQEGSWMQI